MTLTADLSFRIMASNRPELRCEQMELDENNGVATQEHQSCTCLQFVCHGRHQGLQCQRTRGKCMLTMMNSIDSNKYMDLNTLRK